MTAQPRIVIIGAGIVGTNLADELAQLGMTNTLVIERGPRRLMGGSTSHAPGLVFQANGSRNMTRFATYTVEKMLAAQQDGEGCFNQVGGIEVATTDERLQELHRRAGWLRASGVEAQVLSPKKTLEKFPLLDEDFVLGSLWNPTDGVALARRFVELLIQKTEAAGVEYRFEEKVTGIDTDHGRVTGVRIGQESIPADIVVSAAGFWGPEIADMVGVKIPLIPIAHQFAWSSDVPELADYSKGGAVNCALPLLRFQDRDLYYRMWDQGWGIGSYAHPPFQADPYTLGMDPDTITMDSMPSSLEFTPEHFEDQWEDSKLLLPSLREATVKSGFNGIFSFTPDGGSLIGESRQVKGFFMCEAVWVTHSAGLARATAQLIHSGESEIDISDSDVNRFDAWQQERDYVETTSKQNFVEVYDIRHPQEPRLFPRGVLRSPFHERQVEQSAFFMEASGWERPQWYSSNLELLPELPDEWAGPLRPGMPGRFYSHAVAVEAWKTRTGVAMYDMTALRRALVEGPGASAFLQSLTSNKVDKSVGSVTYTLLLSASGTVASDVTITRLGDQKYQVGANGPRDIVYLEKQAEQWIAEHGWEHAVFVRDITAETCCIGLWGPNARRVLEKITHNDVSADALKYFRSADITIGYVPATAMRLSYVGELGWEIYTQAGYGAELWDSIARAGKEFGIIPAGRAAFNALRLEKGYRSWGADVTAEHFPAQAGLGFAVGAKKTGYVGHDALQQHDDAADSHRLRTLTLNDRTQLLMGGEPVFVNGSPAGYVTSAEYGFTVGRTVALAWVPASLEGGDRVEVEFYGRRQQATVRPDVLVDPGMEKIRA